MEENKENVEETEVLEEESSAEPQIISTEEVNEPTEEAPKVEETTEPVTLEEVKVEEKVEEPVEVEKTEEPATIDLPKVEDTTVGESAVEENTEEKVEGDLSSVDGEEPKKKLGTGALIGIIVAVLALLIVGGYFLYNNVLYSSKNIINKEISTVFDGVRKVKKAADSKTLDVDLEKDSLAIDGELTINSDYNANGVNLDKLKDYKIEYNGYLSKKDNLASGSAKLLKSTTPVLGLSTHAEGKDVYVDLGDLYTKVLKTELDAEIKDLEITKSINDEDFEKVISRTEISTKEYLEGVDSSKSKANTTINGKSGSYTKVTYKVKVSDYMKKLLTDYENDEQVLKILSDLSNKKESEFKKDLEEAKKDVEDSKDEITVNSYLSGFVKELKEIELIANDKEENRVVINYEGKEKQYVVFSEGKEAITGKYNENTGEYSIESKVESNTMSIIGKITDNVITAKADAKVDGMDMSIDMEMKNVVNNDTQDTDLTIKVALKEGEEDLTATISNKLKLSKNGKVAKVNTVGATAAETLTEADINTIYNNAAMKLMLLINDIMPAMASQMTSAM